MNYLKKIFSPGKSKTIHSYEDFWNWFKTEEKKFFKIIQSGKDPNQGFFDRLSPKLDELGEGFYFLAGMMNDQTAELVITSDGAIEKFVFVEELVEAAPEIKGWKFTAHKTPMPDSGFEIKMGDFTYGIKNLKFYSEDDPSYPDEIEIMLVHDDYNKKNADDIARGSLIFLDNLLGEIDSVCAIDNIRFCSPAEAKQELVSMDKLAAFLNWRQKEFVERYEDVRYQINEDSYALMEAENEKGNLMLAVMNTDLLKWDSKASHPWILKMTVQYKGQLDNGMPDDETYHWLDELENKITTQLKDKDGYLMIGRHTAEGVREFYMACREFRKPSKVVAQVIAESAGKAEISFEIYKDKYWRSLKGFQPSL